MNRKDLKVGMKVVFRSWEDMEREYGKNGSHIKGPIAFNEGMRPYCGNAYIIDDIAGRSNNRAEITLVDEKGKNIRNRYGSGCWTFENWMVNPFNSDESCW